MRAQAIQCVDLPRPVRQNYRSSLYTEKFSSAGRNFFRPAQFLKCHEISF